MAERRSIAEFSSNEQLANARRLNRFDVEIDDLDESTAERVKKLCSENGHNCEIEKDSTPGRFRILISNANLAIIEQIEGILKDFDK